LLFLAWLVIYKSLSAREAFLGSTYTTVVLVRRP
jgi:hypothetical protein